MRGFWGAISAAIAVGGVCCSGVAQAQDAPASQLVERSFRALPNRDAQIGVYVNVRPDCSSGPLPTIRLASPPSSGNVVVKNGKVKVTNYKACLALEVPAYVAFYKSSANFLGNDVLTLEIRYQDGRTEIQKITVSVVGGAKEQKI